MPDESRIPAADCGAVRDGRTAAAKAETKPAAGEPALCALARELLSSPVPPEEECDDISSALAAMGIKRTGAAMVAFGIWRKAFKGDVSAAKLIRELSEDAVSADPADPAGTVDPGMLSSMSDAELLSLLGEAL